MNLNRGQVLSIVIAVLGVLVASTSQLTELFGPTVTKSVVSASTLAMSILAGINMALQGQSSQLAAVQAMPGVEKIVVNQKANATLATMAVDPAQLKIEPTQSAQKTVEAIAAKAAS